MSKGIIDDSKIDAQVTWKSLNMFQFEDLKIDFSFTKSTQYKGNFWLDSDDTYNGCPTFFMKETQSWWRTIPYFCKKTKCFLAEHFDFEHKTASCQIATLRPRNAETSRSIQIKTYTVIKYCGHQQVQPRRHCQI